MPIASDNFPTAENSINEGRRTGAALTTPRPKPIKNLTRLEFIIRAKLLHFA